MQKIKPQRLQFRDSEDECERQQLYSNLRQFSEQLKLYEDQLKAEGEQIYLQGEGGGQAKVKTLKQQLNKQKDEYQIIGPNVAIADSLQYGYLPSENLIAQDVDKAQQDIFQAEQRLADWEKSNQKMQHSIQQLIDSITQDQQTAKNILQNQISTLDECGDEKKWDLSQLQEFQGIEGEEIEKDILLLQKECDELEQQYQLDVAENEEIISQQSEYMHNIQNLQNQINWLNLELKDSADSSETKYQKIIDQVNKSVEFASKTFQIQIISQNRLGFQVQITTNLSSSKNGVVVNKAHLLDVKIDGNKVIDINIQPADLDVKYIDLKDRCISSVITEVLTKLNRRLEITQVLKQLDEGFKISEIDGNDLFRFVLPNGIEGEIEMPVWQAQKSGQSHLKTLQSSSRSIDLSQPLFQLQRDEKFQHANVKDQLRQMFQITSQFLETK
eukprot:TRINITY_DN5108_c0_g2_i10.p1 TRINITY_DN5108_c0_g2~~TRINITY_DN5108_c0_g2_i10.p1  ORF type:complete len:463 (-),score=59.40 TRINITY_DN5108_c0_g2_i10:138-1466(-)